MTEALVIEERVLERNRIRKVEEKVWAFEKDPRLESKPMKKEKGELALGKVPSISKAWLLLIVMFLLLIFSGLLLRLLDPTAAVLDIGILSILLLVLFSICLFQGMARWMTDRLFDQQLGMDQAQRIETFKQLKPWQKIGLYLLCYSSLFWGLVLVLTVVV